MAISITPKTLAAGPNNPSKQVSKNVWNAGHELTAAPEMLIGTDGSGVATEYGIGTGPGQIPSSEDLETAISGLDFVAEADLSASGGSDMAGYINAGTGATSRTVQDRLRDVVSVRDFGATGDGATDDTAAIQAAIDSLSTGGALLFPKGAYRITSGLTVVNHNLRLVGTGKQGTVIRQATAAQPILTVSGYYFSIADMTLDYATQGVAGGIALDIDAAFYSGATNLFIHKAYIGVKYHNSANSHMAAALVVIDCTLSGVSIENAVNVNWTDCQVINGDKVNYCTNGCINLRDQVEGCNFLNVACYQGVYSLYTSSAVYGTGQRPSFNKFIGCYFDASGGSVISNATELDFTDCWFSARGTGAYIISSDGIRFTGGNIINCDSNGAVLDTGSVRVSFVNVSVRSNGSALANSYDGIAIVAGISDFRIQGCTFTNSVITFGTQRYGVNLLAGASDRYVIADNFVTGNGTGGINDGGAGANKRVANNY